MTTDYKKGLNKLFRALFHFESVNLDLGFFDIVNQNQKKIEELILKESSTIIDEIYGRLSSQKKTEIKKEVFSYIYKFFSRYYDDGEFFSLQKYNNKKRYIISQNDEDVHFHWINKDHYYVKTRTSDFFIHKNLKEFLLNELNFLIKNEVINSNNIEDIKFDLLCSEIIKNISSKIISYLSQIEEFQKAFWEKTKFIISTDYLITLDYIDEKLYPEILTNEDQIAEWKKLHSLDFPEDTDKQVELLQRKKSLCLDTKFFDSDFKFKILNNLDNIDTKINGILMNSENYQALNLLLPKYESSINFCYIDPPYNTGTDDFLYKDDFHHSSWITLMKNRLDVFKQLMSEDGTFFCSIDDKEQPYLRLLCDDIFGEENFESFIWKKKGFSSNTEKILGILTEYILCYFNNKREGIFNYRKINRQYRYRDEIGPYNLEGIEKTNLGTYQRETMRFPIVDPKTNETFLPRKDKRWTLGEASLKEAIKQDKILFDYKKKRAYLIKRPEDYELSKNVFYNLLENIGSLNLAKNELRNLFGNREIFDTPKPTKLLVRLLEIASKSDSIVLDYFAGSGTTGQAVLELNRKDKGNRKFILIEMGEFFDTILKPRVTKAIYSNKWKNGKPINKKGIKKQIIKYHLIEQFEDALNSVSLNTNDTLSYGFNFMENRITSNLFANQIMDPLNSEMRVIEENSAKILPIDLVETFNYLLGIQVDKIKLFFNDAKYRVVYGKRNDSKVTIIWRSIQDLDLQKDKDFIENVILKTYSQPDVIYVNGDSSIKNAILIDEEIRKLMDL
ncbi:MAG: site-specific DNA-methyltransferase [Asgard group archaeon]|nr:site-specific DNA-methyltransferase [Asgard group archaeon]